MGDETKPRRKPGQMRSQQWFGRQDRDGFNYRSWVKGKGVPHDQFDGRPVIGICNTFSELTPCNSHFRVLAEQVKIGVYEAGGFPLEFPVMSLGETLLRPTAMLYRNLASMDVEESIRGNPIDGVVLLMGCDKTTPSLVMGAASADLPTIGVSGGPMLSGKWRGQELGSGTGVWSMSEQVRAGTLRLQRLPRGRELHAPKPRALHDDGHGEHHGLDGGGPRARPARQRRRIRRSTAGATCWPLRRSPRGRDGARGPRALEDPDARGVRERDQDAGRDRRFDQCRHPPPRHRRPHRREARARRLRPPRQRVAVPRRPAAIGQGPDGGLLLRGRPAGGDEGIAPSLHLGSITGRAAGPSAPTSKAPRNGTRS
jgi:hypothetical protein